MCASKPAFVKSGHILAFLMEGRIDHFDLPWIGGSAQCWGRYFEKVTSYILLVTSVQEYSNSLHISY